MNIEKRLFPHSDKLIEENGVFVATIVDIELDPIDCSFIGDNCVEIDVSGYSYITLSLRNLAVLKRLILQADKQVNREKQCT